MSVAFAPICHNQFYPVPWVDGAMSLNQDRNLRTVFSARWTWPTWKGVALNHWSQDFSCIIFLYLICGQCDWKTTDCGHQFKMWRTRNSQISMVTTHGRCKFLAIVCNCGFVFDKWRNRIPPTFVSSALPSRNYQPAVDTQIEVNTCNKMYKYKLISRKRAFDMFRYVSAHFQVV